MTTTYTKTLISDEATDNGSPITETLMQDIGQSVNYLIDVLTNRSGNVDAAPAIGYDSSWTNINNGASNDFPHSLGYTPSIVLVWRNPTAGSFTNSILCGAASSAEPEAAGQFIYIKAVDGTNVTIENLSGANQYVKILCW